MCGSAQKVMNANKDKPGIEPLVRMQDDFYRLEKDVMDAGEATSEQKIKAKKLYNDIMALAGNLDLADDIGGYMKQHIDSVIKGDPKPGFGRTDLKEFKEQDMPCPPATKDLELNTKNRDATIKNHNYGPLNVDEPGDYWEKIAKYWKTTEEAAKKSVCNNCVAFDVSPRMLECMPGETSDEDGRLGYCHMHHFKCHSARACHTWAKGGPITTDEKSYDWQERGQKKENYKESLWANIHKKRQRIKQGSGERMRKKGEKGAPTAAQLKRAKGEGYQKFNQFVLRNHWGEVTEKAEYQGRPVELNNPTRGDTKKFKVYVRNDKGNVVKVEYGDPNMSIKRDDPERRKSFRARHNCDNPGPKYKARYWSCKFWEKGKSVTDLMKG